MLPLTLLSVLSLFASSALAGSVQVNGSCSQNNNRLTVGTYEFDSDCDSVAFCGSDGVCHAKACRRDIFPFGYPQNDDNLPKLCPSGQFCPDEEDACQSLVAPGGTCQLNRDDECQPPPNAGQLADKRFGTNVNGAVCLNAQCYWANITSGQTCVVENTPYTVYFSGGEAIDIVSRGNCQLGLYCDSQSVKCTQQKDLGASCVADKECSSMNCLASSVCGEAFDVPRHFGTWVYVVVGIGIFGGMIGTLVGLFFLHARQRDQEREKRIQYWREQNAFRQNIMQMRDTARASLLSLPLGGTNSARSTLYDEQTPITQHPSQQARGSGLRKMSVDDVNSDGEMDLTNVVREREDDAPRFRSGRAF